MKTSSIIDARRRKINPEVRRMVDLSFKIADRIHEVLRPLVFFDLKTTGTQIATDRIVEISMVKVMPDGEKITQTRRINPGMPIPPEATAVHGITDDDVKDCPCFSEIAQSLADEIQGCDLAGFNSDRFDIPLLAEEFCRAEVDVDFRSMARIDVQTIFRKMDPCTLIAAYKFYCGKDLNDAHSAEADTMATYEVLKAKLGHNPDLQNDVDFLSEYTQTGNNVDFAGRFVYNDKHQEVFNFGKYKGQLVEEVFKSDPSYYVWLMSADFPLNTKQVATRIRLRGINKR